MVSGDATFNSKVTLGDSADAVVLATGQLTASNGLVVSGSFETAAGAPCQIQSAFAANKGGSFGTFGEDDTTPSVALGNLWKTDDAAGTITMFDDGLPGQTITVLSMAAIVFDVTSTNLKGGSTNITTGAGDLTSWTFDGTNWYLLQFMDVSADMSSVTGGGGSARSVAGDNDNGIITWKASDDTFVGESNLTFDGTTMALTGGMQVGYRSGSWGNATNGLTASASDYIIGVTTLVESKSILLPLAENAGAGRVIVIKDEGGAAAAKNIGITASSGDKIDGRAHISIDSNYASVNLYSDGIDDWHIF